MGFSGGVPMYSIRLSICITAATSNAEAVAAADDPHANCNTAEAEGKKTHLDL